MPLQKKHYEKLIQKYNVSNEQLKKSDSRNRKLNPKPGGAFTETIKLRKM
jgi:RNA polymerase sigma-54 factor